MFKEYSAPLRALKNTIDHTPSVREISDIAIPPPSPIFQWGVFDFGKWTLVAPYSKTSEPAA